MQARIRSVGWEADHILCFRLEPLPGQNFPPFTSGGHIEVSLQPGLSRSYSLLNDPAEANAYVIGVQLDPPAGAAPNTYTSTGVLARWWKCRSRATTFLLKEDAAHTVMWRAASALRPCCR